MSIQAIDHPVEIGPMNEGVQGAHYFWWLRRSENLRDYVIDRCMIRARHRGTNGEHQVSVLHMSIIIDREGLAITGHSVLMESKWDFVIRYRSIKTLVSDLTTRGLVKYGSTGMHKTWGTFCP